MLQLNLWAKKENIESSNRILSGPRPRKIQTFQNEKIQNETSNAKFKMKFANENQNEMAGKKK